MNKNLNLSNVNITFKESENFRDSEHIKDQYKTYDVKFQFKNIEHTVQMIGFKDDELAYKSLNNWIQMVLLGKQKPRIKIKKK